MGTFCYELRGGGAQDVYRFNTQKRHVPFEVAWRESEKETMGVCQGFCRHKVGGLNMLDGEALTAISRLSDGVGPQEWSAIQSYGDTDDMCKGCK